MFTSLWSRVASAISHLMECPDYLQEKENFVIPSHYTGTNTEWDSISIPSLSGASKVGLDGKFGVRCWDQLSKIGNYIQYFYLSAQD